jgi:glycosyltransferase involved in cell wall biosynthesis
MMRKNVAILQPVVPDYRVPVFQALHEHYGDAFNVYAADASRDGTIRMDERAAAFVHPVTNRQLFGGGLVWQRGHERELLAATLVIAPGSLRFLSVPWLIARRKIAGKPTILWGHYDGSRAWAARFRNAMFRLPDGYIAYTHTDGDKIRRIRGDDRVWVASNSCVWRQECRAVKLPGQVPQDVLFVGRLVREKKPLLLVDAFAHAVGRGGIPHSARLVITGDGPLRAELETKAAALGMADRTIFTGHISDHEQLEQLYARAIVAASPGYIGLSAIQSFAAGVPMVVSRNEKHSPEIEACKEGFNTVFFETDSVESLASTLSVIFTDSTAWRHRRPQIAEAIAGGYTYDGMINAFKSAIDTFI